MIRVLLLALLLTACTPPEHPPLISRAAAEEFDAAPPMCSQFKRTLLREVKSVWGPDADIALFAAQVYQESACNPDARSPVGAMGLAQFMPGTSADMARRYPDLGENQPANPDWALRALARYDLDLWTRARYPDECHRVGAMLSQYNGGPGWHDKRRARALNANDFWSDVRLINPGIIAANQRENEQYPERIVRHQPKFAGWGGLVCEGRLG